jgi:hypothetical protein
MNKENPDLSKSLNAEARIGDFPMAPSVQNQGSS